MILIQKNSIISFLIVSYISISACRALTTLEEIDSTKELDLNKNPLIIPSLSKDISKTLLAQNSPKDLKKKKDALRAGVLGTVSLIEGQVLNSPLAHYDLDDPYPEIIDIPNVYKANEEQIQLYTKWAGISASEPDKKCKDNWCCENCLKYASGCQVIKTFSTIITDSTGYILKCDDEKKIYVNFRGARSTLNFLEALSQDLVNFESVHNAKVIRGIYQSAIESLDHFVPELQKLLANNPSHNVIVIGHSLGGSIAGLAAMLAFRQAPELTSDNLSVVTLGAFRIGNYEYAKYVSDTHVKHFRLVNRKEHIPHRPPTSFGLYHAGIEIWDRPDACYICDFPIEALFCSNTLQGHSLSTTEHRSSFGIQYGVGKELL